VLKTLVLRDFSWTPYDSPRAVGYTQIGENAWQARGSVFRDLKNLRWDEGALERRSGLYTLGANEPTFNHGTTEDVRFIFQGASTDNAVAGPTTILVTDQSFYHFYDGTWTEFNPTYSVGTIDIDAAGTAITGNSTVWVTQGISDEDQITFGGTDYQISTVDSNTGITMSEAIPGGPLSTQAYSIRRLHYDRGGISDLHAVVFNGDLYMACSRGAGLGPSNTGQMAVIKATNCFGKTAPTATYLTGDHELDVGLDDFTDRVEWVSGLALLPDGRVVISIEQETERISRIRYSSPSDTTVWTTTPGGFTDVVGVGEGRITALGKIGSSLTVHYVDGIALAHFTGQDDPPLDFTTTAAEVGAWHHRYLINYNQGECFVGKGGGVYRFNGSGIVEVAREFRDEAFLPTFSDFKNLGADSASGYDYMRGEFIFTKGNTLYGFGERGSRNAGYPGPITAMSSGYLGMDIFAGRSEAHMLMGLSHLDTGSERLFLVQERGPSELDFDDTQSSSASRKCVLQTMPLDFGYPGQKKTIDRILVFSQLTARNQIAAEDRDDLYMVEVSDDGGANYTDLGDVTMTYTSQDTGGETWGQWAAEGLNSSESWVVRVTMGTDVKFVGQVFQILVRFEVVDDLEAFGGEGNFGA